MELITSRVSSPPRATISIELFLDPLNQPLFLGTAKTREGGLEETHLLSEGPPDGGVCAIRINHPELVLPDAISFLMPELEMLLLMGISRARARNGNPDISLQ